MRGGCRIPVETLVAQGLRKMNPFCIPFSIHNMAGALLAMDLGFMGPNYPINTACATGNYCILSCGASLLPNPTLSPTPVTQAWTDPYATLHRHCHELMPHGRQPAPASACFTELLAAEASCVSNTNCSHKTVAPSVADLSLLLCTERRSTLSGEMRT